MPHPTLDQTHGNLCHGSQPLFTPRIKSAVAIALLLQISLFSSGCDTPEGSSNAATAAGAGAGALAGLLAGGRRNGPAGALIGAFAGATLARRYNGGTSTDVSAGSALYATNIREQKKETAACCATALLFLDAELKSSASSSSEDDENNYENSGLNRDEYIESLNNASDQ